MSKCLVAYFSATGVTKGVAEKLADITDGDLYEIIPQILYTKKDLDWTDKNSRSSVEMNDCMSRPKIAGKVENITDYDVIYLGFPIWWYVAPTIINTFLESYDLTGKTIIPFATSGSSGMGDTVEKLKLSAKGANILDGKRFESSVSKEELKSWIKEL